MEVKIGVQNAGRELSVETGDAPEQVLAALDEALTRKSVFSLTDEKGSTVAVPAEKVAYLYFTADSGRPVGFGQVAQG
ncbi:MAG: DUF3107 domain-containing protein [Aeromicrobium sp.]|uniref:DUF3107 domain-containing protein n=1 Tax=Aeromicrobium sp. TaxID=1871063 RepID=UPI0039E2EAC4